MLESTARASLIRFSWKGDRMYLGTKRTLYGLLKHESYSTMFYIYTPSGVSVDFYNISRAKQHCVYLYRKDCNLIKLDK